MTPAPPHSRDEERARKLIGFALSEGTSDERWIAALVKAFAEVRREAGWVPVSSPPKHQGWFLTARPIVVSVRAAYWDTHQWRVGPWAAELPDVTHWMPLPAPPEDAKP